MPSRPVHVVGDREIGDVEAGAEHDRIDLARGAVAPNHGLPVISLTPVVSYSTFGCASAG